MCFQLLKRLTSSVSCALDEAAAALTRMRADPHSPEQQAAAALATNAKKGGANKAGGNNSGSRRSR